MDVDPVHRSVRGYDLNSRKVINRQPKRAAEPSHATTQSQSGDTGVGDHARWDHFAFGDERLIEIAQQGSAANVYRPGLFIHDDRIEP
ncbi:hypothetical protein PTKU15_79230 [Paraburkholderia terrae]|nr:hypothetical protein PTKU15_79230 [Paraburkholderia terrae]